MNQIFQSVCLILFFAAAICFGQTNDTIRVGVFLDMSGQTSSFGTATYNGIKMAVAEINASGGVDGRMIKIYLEDDEGRPERAKFVVEKLISEEKVNVIIGEVASANSLAGGRIAQEAKIPMITPASSNPKVTEVGNYIFRACFIDPFQGEAMAKFSFNELRNKRVAILSDVSSDYAKGLNETFSRTFTKLGGKIITKQLYAQRDSDFRAQLTEIRKLKPDAIYLSSYYAEVGVIAKQVRELKLNVPLLGGDGWDSPEIWNIGGKALNNSYITNHFALDNPNEKVQQFAGNYESKFYAKPESLAALGYDTIYLLANAVRRAKSTDGEQLRDAIAQTKNFSGVTGNININEDRNAVKPVVILKLNAQNNQFIYYSTIKP
jgi:branched-chain amino acid transport system substrate-binding protein